ncbi:hypothetical protein RI367_001389 [Sorochytrium milnesiophthora]
MDSEERSLHVRSRSTGALHAMLSDPNLHGSLRDLRSLDEDEPANARARFARSMKRYYYQLAVGCGNARCNNRLCRSNVASQKLSADAAAILAVQLATRPTSLFCPRCPEDPEIALPSSLNPYQQQQQQQQRASVGSPSSSPSGSSSVSTPAASAPKPFLYSLLSSSPFTSLFASTQPSPQQQHHSSAVGISAAAAAHRKGLAASTASGQDQSLRKQVLSTSVMRNQSQENLASARPTSRQRTSSAPHPYTPLSSSSSTPSLQEPAAMQYTRSSEAPPPPTMSRSTSSDGLMNSRPKSLLDLPTLLSTSASFTSRLTRTISQQLVPQSVSEESLSSYNSSEGLETTAGDEQADREYDEEEEEEEEEEGADIVLRYLTLPLLQKAVDAYREEDEWALQDQAPLTASSSSLHSTRQASPTADDEAVVVDRTPTAAGLAPAFANSPRRSPSSHSSLGSGTPRTREATGTPRSFGLHSRSNSLYTMSITSPSLQFIERSLQSVFSDSDCLNESFKSAGTGAEHASGLDLPSITAAYDLVLSIEPASHIRMVLCNAIELLLAKLALNSSAINSRRELPQFLILLENPLVHDSKYQESLLKPLCLILAHLKPRLKATLVQWFSVFPSHKIAALVRTLQRYITEHYYPSPKMDEALVSAVRMLGLFYSANEHAQAPMVDYTLFYNSELCRKLNFKDEYRQWRKTLEKKSVVDFSFLNYPFLFDVVDKSRIMHIDAMVQMSIEYEEACIHQALVIHTQRLLQDTHRSLLPVNPSLQQATNPYLVLEVRREQLIADVLAQISHKQRDLKKPLKVKFVGGGEEGMDQGGVQKEFFQVIVGNVVDPVYGLFVYDDKTRYNWINANSLESERQFELVGTVMGLAVYNGVILDVKFPRLMYRKLLGEEVTLEDVKAAFPDLGRGLEQMLEWTDGDVEDVFMRSFEISVDVYGHVKTVPLVAGGENVAVTNANRHEYVKLYVDYVVNKSVARQFDAFKRGFQRVCGGFALKMCRPEELELLMCGQECDLDFHELEQACGYDDGYSGAHPTIRHFWSVVHGMSYEHKKKLLNFVTASDRVPVKGLGHIVFVVQRNGPDSERLPTALTCFGRLLLPEYASMDKLRNRLMTAIDNAKGFGLV